MPDTPNPGQRRFPDNDNIPMDTVFKGIDMNRWDDMARHNEPWEDQKDNDGPDTRTTQDLWDQWVMRYANRDVQTFEGNQRASQRVPFGKGN